MPSPFLSASLHVLASFLVLSHFPSNTHGLTVTHEFVDNDLYQGCELSLAGRTYDLCPLFETDNGVVNVDAGKVPGKGSKSKRAYEIVLDGSRTSTIHEQLGESSHSSCPEGTWICMTDKLWDGHASYVFGGRKLVQTNSTPIAGKSRPASVLVDDGVNAGATLHINDSDEAKPLLNLFLIGGYGLDEERRYGNIEFRCTAGEDDVRFISEHHGVHSFVWSTRHACATPSSSVHDMFNIAEAEGDGEGGGEDDEDKKESDDLLPGNQNSKLSRRWIAAIVLLSGASIIFTYILVSSPPARHLVLEHLHSASYAVLPLIHRVSGKLEPLQKSFRGKSSAFRFRQGDSRLVRWAQEDMMIDSEDGDLDVMVNGNVTDDRWNVEELDEYIPLKMSPRWNTGRKGSRLAVQSYGAADTESLHEAAEGANANADGIWSRVSKLFGRR